MKIKILTTLAITLAAISTAAQAQPRQAGGRNIKQQCLRNIIDHATLRAYSVTCFYSDKEGHSIRAAYDRTEQFINRNNCRARFTEAELTDAAEAELNRIGRDIDNHQACIIMKSELPQIIGRYIR